MIYNKQISYNYKLNKNKNKKNILITIKEWYLHNGLIVYILSFIMIHVRSTQFKTISMYLNL